ncbi:MAG: twin-arginine translocase subunit TatC [Eggerthellaceae bacterium]|nr:twin-arginine translocase subunit TatC [Eggerthellaceae bacterium]
MPLLDHLAEIRIRLVRIFVLLAFAICVFYLCSDTIGNFLIQPISEFLPQSDTGTGQLFALAPFEPFGTRFKIAFWTSVVACVPFIFWQILAFILPALRKEERLWFVPTFACCVALFFVGMVFCYLVILNPAFEFLTQQSGNFGTILPQMSAYISIILKFLFGFGAAFQIPIIVYYMVFFKIVPYKKLRSAWRGIYVGLLVFSAIVTPDVSPVTMAFMFAALILLYETSLLLARLSLRKNIKQQAGAEDEDSKKIFKQMK